MSEPHKGRYIGHVIITDDARVNIGNALLYGLPTDLNLQGTQLNTALSVFFVTYCTFEIPANIPLKRTRPHVFCRSLTGIVQGHC